jgi:MerR family transcriptional regulator, light-induced transcriptional regulator
MNSPIKAGISISAVERDTGLAKDTLRVWERRYGFPAPHRDAVDDRLYPAEQVEHLHLIKRLMDQGKRPGALLRLPIEELQSQLAQLRTDRSCENSEDWVIDLLKKRDVDQLRHELAQRLARDGLDRFVTDTVPALNRRIGEGWMNGEIQIFEEHLYTELVQNQLRSLIHGLANRGHRPHVLLTTVKDEEHLLGLLMAEALLAANGAWCLSLGAQTPLLDIAGAAHGTTIDIVALSFSAAYPWRKARTVLTELRGMLPERTELWAGGAALNGRGKAIAGVRTLTNHSDIAAALNHWRSTHLSTSSGSPAQPLHSNKASK